MKPSVIVFAALLAAPGLAAAATGATKEQSRLVCEQAASRFAAGDHEGAYGALVPHWPLPAEEIRNLGYQTKTQMAMVGERFGKGIGAEFVETITAGDSLLRHIFLIKHENHALRFSCVFYRPRDGWLVNSIVWDDKPQALLDG